MLMTASALLTAGCSGDETEPIYDAEGYILFDSQVLTRVPIITEMNGRTFDVVTYEYNTDWIRSKARTAPTPKFPFPTPVACASNGSCSYDASGASLGTPLVPWGAGKNYAFFAYFPQRGTNGLTLNTGAGSTGAPIIQYTPAVSGNADGLADVMTSYIIDKNSTGDGVVYFDFSHRLALLTVDAMNLNEETEYIRNLTVTFDGPIYNNIVIPLDPNSVTTRNWNSNPATGASYTINTTALTSVDGKAIAGTPQNATNLQHVPVSEDKNITFIPISKAEVFALTSPPASKPSLGGRITFERKEDGVWNSKTVNFVCDNDIEAGKKYSLLITFSREVISLTVISSGDWLPMSQTITFE